MIKHQNTELEELLKGLLGSEVIVTPTAMSMALACVVRTIQDSLDKKEEEDMIYNPAYATPKQLAVIFGADKVTLWRQLSKLESEGRVEVLRFPSPSGAAGHPRYKIADVVKAFKCA